MNLPLGTRLTIVLVAFERLSRIFSLGVCLRGCRSFPRVLGGIIRGEFNENDVLEGNLDG